MVLHLDAVHTDVIAVTDPSTGMVLDTIPCGGPTEADRLVRAARNAQRIWRRLAPAHRAHALKEAALAMRAHCDELAELQTREGGKPIADSRGGVMAGITTIEQYAELGPLHRGKALCGQWESTDLMVHEPRGVAAVLTPWNDPIAIACQGIAANLVVGNAVVIKPSERTPLSTIRLVELLRAHLPDNVLAVGLGDGRLGQALVEHPYVDIVLHTGSVRTGREVAITCARHGKKAVLELGGKDPLLVDEGVDPVWAAEQAAIGAFANAGQLCVSIERVYAHTGVHDAFVEALVEQARSLRVGDPFDLATQMGPLVDETQLEHVHRQVTAALGSGALAVAGGHRLDGPGSFYAPTVLVNVRDDQAVMREETFGPVAPVRAVADFAEAIDAANESDYGLAAVVLTRSQAHAQQAWRELHVGTVKVNAAFGGAPGGAAQPAKASGQGFGYGPELLDELSRTKVVHLSPAP